MKILGLIAQFAFKKHAINVEEWEKHVHVHNVDYIFTNCVFWIL